MSKWQNFHLRVNYPFTNTPSTQSPRESMRISPNRGVKQRFSCGKVTEISLNFCIDVTAKKSRNTCALSIKEMQTITLYCRVWRSYLFQWSNDRQCSAWHLKSLICSVKRYIYINIQVLGSDCFIRKWFWPPMVIIVSGKLQYLLHILLLGLN